MNNRKLARANCFDNMIGSDGELVTTGMGIRKSLDALVNNLFKGNAGEWATASHVERQGTRMAKPAAGGAAPAPRP